MSTFKLSGKKILLYGAGTKAKTYYRLLKEQDIPIIGFIDKRGREIKYFAGLPVFSLDELKKYTKNKDIVVMLDVKNVFEHDEIALYLMELGIDQILFRPGRVLRGNGNDKERQLNYVYDKILEGKVSFEESIPILDDIRLPIIEDAALVSEENDIVIAKIPVPLVYTWNGVTNQEGWTDQNVSILYPHIRLFKKMLGMEGNSTDYIEMCSSFALQKKVIITEEWKENIIRNRIDVFNNMENSYNYDFDFFMRNSVDGIWNEAKYFNMCSGKHRAMFLIAKGSKYVPLKIKKEEYENYINRDGINKVIEIMKRNKCFKLLAPVEHPFFVSYPCENEQLFYKLANEGTALFAEILKKQTGMIQFKERKILLSIDDCGFLKRHFYRMGLTICCSGDCQITELEMAVNELLQLPIRNFGENDVQAIDFAIVDLADGEKEISTYENINYILTVENKKTEKKYRGGGKKRLIFSSVKMEIL